MDLLLVIIGVFIFAVITIFALHFLQTIEGSLGSVLSSAGQAEVSKGITILQNLDYAIIFLLLGTFIATIIGAFMLDTHPVFFIISLLSLIFIIILAPQFANFFFNFSNTETLSSTSADLPLTTFIFQNLPLITVIFGFILSVVLYAKIHGGGVQSGY